jgi:hypothetical protein
LIYKKDMANYPISKEVSHGFKRRAMEYHKRTYTTSTPAAGWARPTMERCEGSYKRYFVDTTYRSTMERHARHAIDVSNNG